MTVIKGASFRSVPLETLHVKYLLAHSREKVVFQNTKFAGWGVFCHFLLLTQ
jgi:hypothetical protein